MLFAFNGLMELIIAYMNMHIKQKLFCLAIIIYIAGGVHYPTDPTSEISSDDKYSATNGTNEHSTESEHEMETDGDDEKFLQDALKIVNNPYSVVNTNYDKVQKYESLLTKMFNANLSVADFLVAMEKLTLDVCINSQTALWSYIIDTNNDLAKDNMINMATVDDEVKIQYWKIIESNYLTEARNIGDETINRKIKIIKQRARNLQILHNATHFKLDIMQNIWNHASVCAYNTSACTTETKITMNDVSAVFKTSNDTNELEHYWTSFRDATGMKIRPFFQTYVTNINEVAGLDNFSDAGEMWRDVYCDDDFINTVDTIWFEVKPLYEVLHEYVRIKLKAFYKDEFKENGKTIPAHLLGDLWAHQWQAIYPKVALHSKSYQKVISPNKAIDLTALLDVVDQFHQSVGFNSSRDSYDSAYETEGECLPSSHDLCDGVHYKIKWCAGNVTDVIEGLSRAARLLSHIQYFRHYGHLDLVFRDGPNPAFHTAISDFFTMQVTSLEYLKTMDIIDVKADTEAAMNHLLWVALGKLPVMAYSYSLDKWRWNMFANSSDQMWNERWWDLRKNEMGLSPPVPRSEQDLDPASKYHVVAHVQYITYLISHVLEFQILLSLCKRANHTGPLHTCSIYGDKEAGKLLSAGMSLGASEDWRTVLKAMTGETDLSTEGILTYFSVLSDYLKEETARLDIELQRELDRSAPITIGVVVVILVLLMLIVYCVKKNVVNKLLTLSGVRKNASLDISTYETRGAPHEVTGVCEDKV